jgi:UDP:flavonoid glycosyltransferase YjiC (YdhE family)
VDRILGDAALQANVRRVQAEIAAMPSPEEAAAAVEEVARAEAAA